MEIKSILGNYEPIDENWLGLVEGDDKTMIKLRSSAKWAEEYIKLISKYDNNIVAEQKVKVISGGNRVIRKSTNNDENKKMTPEQEKEFQRELIEFTIDSIIVDWKGVEENGVEIPYNKENALKLFDMNNTGTIVLVFTIIHSALERDNFTKASEYIIEDEEIVKK